MREISKEILADHSASTGSTNEVSLDPMAFLYGAYFVYKLVPAEAEAFKSEEVEVSVGDSSKSCYLDPSKAASLQIEERNKPRGRQDGWLEIEMGTISTEKYSKAKVKLLVMNHNFGVVICTSLTCEEATTKSKKELLIGSVRKR